MERKIAIVTVSGREDAENQINERIEGEEPEYSFAGIEEVEETDEGIGGSKRYHLTFEKSLLGGGAKGILNRDEANPIVWASGGPRLVLYDGSVVEPSVEMHGDELFAVATDQGSTVYGRHANEHAVSLTFVDDPDANEIPAVRESKRVLTGGDDG